MYTVPSYVTYRTEEDAIYITSELYRNTVRLTDHGLQKEFINLTRCGGCAELNTPLTRYLHEQELLVTEEELDHALHQVRSLLDNIFMVTLMPTEGCNFRCPYCYEDHHAVSMTRDTLDRIEEYITAQAPRYKQVILAWFGGEPTLCKDTVLEVSNIVQNLQKQYGFHYAANMTTNGYLLNDKLFRQFYQAGITSYQITIDGWNHDKTRPHVSGKGTLQTIINNLASLSKLPPAEYRCFLISKDLLHHGVSEEVYHKMLDSDETDSNKSSEEVTFILTITYKCNMHCTYCYQQNDKTLEKKLISDETLDKILSIIAQYMEANPNKTVRLGLFGGEPLLIENEKVIDKILQFCKEHKTTVHITTNGSFLSYYLKKFIINRRFISGIYPTIDSMALNYMTRYDLDPSRNNTNETFKLLCCIKTLLHYGIHVDLGTNIDRHNHKEIWNTLDDLKKLQLLQDKNFAWTIGRVDDRLYETNFPDIMMESEILAELQSKPLPDNVHAAFLKTCYNFADKMGLKLNLREHKQTHSYCWSTSSSSNVFYVDMNLKTYRCTCTVGRSRYSLFDFSYENLTNYRPVAVTCNSYAECKDCKIGGFCGGGCQLSHQIDFKKCCTYEEEVFSHFMKTLFIPYIKSKYNEVNQNERKAENRCT